MVRAAINAWGRLFQRLCAVQEGVGSVQPTAPNDTSGDRPTVVYMYHDTAIEKGCAHKL